MIELNAARQSPVLSHTITRIRTHSEEDVPSGTDHLIVNTVLHIVFPMTVAYAEIQVVPHLPTVVLPNRTVELTVQGDDVSHLRVIVNLFNVTPRVTEGFVHGDAVVHLPPNTY